MAGCFLCVRDQQQPRAAGRYDTLKRPLTRNLPRTATLFEKKNPSWSSELFQFLCKKWTAVKDRS